MLDALIFEFKTCDNNAVAITKSYALYVTYRPGILS